MKSLNILSFIQAYKELDENLFNAYAKTFMVEPDKDELDDLQSYIDQFQLHLPKAIRAFNEFFLGYRIPQISKEFDLLRFGNNYIVNLELKKENTGDKIKIQLIQNQYYLSFLGKKTYCLTYVASEKKLYSLDNNHDLEEKDFSYLSKILFEQDITRIENIDNLFNPSNYLVSPFNSTIEFIKGEYFLTNHQEAIKKDVIKKIKTPDSTFISICGKAGTGKTLLTYDIAKEYIKKNIEVLIIHCGYLNEGHFELREKYNWNITPIKEFRSYNLAKYTLIVIDEAQRIYPPQLKEIIAEIKKSNRNCIFSYDRQQCLRKWEINNNIEDVIIGLTSPILHELTEKIRTNKEIAAFITGLMNNKKNIGNIEIKNVNLCYFDNYADAKRYIRLIGEQGWKIINYTPSKKHKHPYEYFSIFLEDNAHKVIGQEFDKVIAVIDQHFYYNEKNKLATKNYSYYPYYHPTKMLFQILTRTRRKLSLVIIKNEIVLNRCLEILNN